MGGDEKPDAPSDTPSSFKRVIQFTACLFLVGTLIFSLLAFAKRQRYRSSGTETAVAVLCFFGFIGCLVAALTYKDPPPKDPSTEPPEDKPNDPRIWFGLGIPVFILLGLGTGKVATMEKNGSIVSVLMTILFFVLAVVCLALLLTYEPPTTKP